jgi:ATP-dependent helicase/nuclease subunit B
MAVEGMAPVPLLAALKHPLAAGGEPPASFRRRVRALERQALRGLRPAPGIIGLRHAVQGDEAAQRAALELIDILEAAISPLIRLLDRGAVSLSQILEAHLAAAEALATTADQPGAKRLWAGDAGEALASFFAELGGATVDGAAIPAAEYPELLDSLMAGHVVRPKWGRHPRLAIWGPLEARLQRSDVMILGSLNEDSWPPKGQASPWMSRPMLQAFGLPLPERRIGLSAHDFCQAFSAPEVWLTRARRKEGAPTVPSRWLLRLRAAMQDNDWTARNAQTQRKLLNWQRLLDAPTAIASIQPPAPCPPVAARPRQLAVTQVEKWLRDPYELYARHILGLRALKPINAEPEAADFGTFVHAALAAFLTGNTDPFSAEAYDRLLAFGREAIGDLLERAGVRTFWWPRFERIARWFIDNERARRCEIVTSAAEVEGRMEISRPGGIFLLTAKADRIDALAGGTLAVIDYKTGQPPREEEVLNGLAPQLPLEAAIAEAGGFHGFGPAKVSALHYWRLRGDDQDCEQRVKALDGLADAALEGLRRLIDAFDAPSTPYASLPRPHLAPRFSEVEHLARVKEWAAGEESGE